MTAELERTRKMTAEEEAQKQQHNALINERYRRLQDAEADQFASGTPTTDFGATTVRASVLTPEAPVYTETPVFEQTPQVTEFVRERIDSPVFTTEKFNAISETAATVVAPAPVAAMPVEIVMPTAAPVASVAVEEQYSLSRMAKLVMAACAVLVVLMLTLICVNTHALNAQSVRIQNLEQRRAELVEEHASVQRRLAEAQSEQTIREYALSQGMIEVQG